MKTLSTGTRAPDFLLPDQDGKFQELGQLLLRGPVVLFFFPTAGSAGCTREAVHFRDLAAEFAAAGAHRLRISMDDSAPWEPSPTGRCWTSRCWPTSTAPWRRATACVAGSSRRSS